MPRHNDPKRVIVHCSVTKDTENAEDPSFGIGVDQIRDWHLKRNFSDVGYHWVIRRDGLLEPGRPEWKIGAHCKGQNTDTLGVCLVGTYKFLPVQIATLLSLYASIKKKNGIYFNNWFTHNHFNAHKTCPGFSDSILKVMLMLFDGGKPVR